MGQLVNMLRSPEDEGQAPAGLEYVASRYGEENNGSLRRYIARRKDGREFPVEINISSLVLDGQRFVVGIIRDISQRQEIEQKLLEMATTDVLTGLCNRRRFLEMAEQELSRAKRYGHCLAMMVLDLDLFKQVNDTYGHQVGDEVLKNLAEVGSACLRRVDLMGRVGGEEFAVLLPETDLEAALPVAERLRQAVEYSCVHLPEGEVCCTVSIGVAQSTPQSELSLETLLKLADDALYAAKKAGRNRVFTAGEPAAAKQASEPAKDRSG
jgi:diguanylate cyclase (GGDEF)-like protein